MCNKTIIKNYNYSCSSRPNFDCRCIAVISTKCIDYYGSPLEAINVPLNHHITLEQILSNINDAFENLDFTVSVDNTSTVNLSGSGSVEDPIIAEVNVSTDEGNIIEARADGLYATIPVPEFEEDMTFAQTVEFDYSGEAGFLIWTSVMDSPVPSTAAFSYTNIRSTGITFEATREVPANELVTDTCHLWVNYAIPSPSGGLAGSGLNLIVLHNDEILYSQALVDIIEGQTGLIDFGPIPSRGKIELFVTENKFDTNGPDSQQGLLTVGGQFVKGGYFTTSLTLNGGGQTRLPNTVNFPSSEAPNLGYVDYTTMAFGPEATDGVIQIDWVAAPGNAGGNTREDITVTFTASVDSGLNFTDNILAGGSYSRTINLTLAQLLANDFKVHFAPTL